MFADDSRIFRGISCVNDTKLLQEDLVNVTNWSTQNNMELKDHDEQKTMWIQREVKVKNRMEDERDDGVKQDGRWETG